MDTYHWDVLVTYDWDVVGCFVWDLLETSWRRTDWTSLLLPFETSSRRSNKMSWRRTTETFWRRSTETSLGVLFEAYLRRCWGLQRNVVTTSLQRLVARWVCSKYVTKTLYRNKFLGSEYIFKLVYHCEGSSSSEICRARDIAEKSLNRLLLQLPEVYCRKKCSSKI